MAVWWVFQNKSYPRSRSGEYLWTPLFHKAGHKKSHWETMAEVQPGDIVLSSVERKIVATSVTTPELIKLRDLFASQGASLF